VRHIGAPEFEPVRGTEGAVGMGIGGGGNWIGYVAPVSERATQLRVYRVPIDGSSPPMLVTDFDPAWNSGVAFLDSRELLFGANQGRAYVRLAEGSTTPSAPKPIDVQGFQGQFAFAKALPRGRGVLLDATWYEGAAYRLGVGVLDLRTGKAKILVKDAGNPLYSPTGHLLFSRGDALYAAPFDLDRLELRGAPVAIMDGLRVFPGGLNASFRLAGNGTLLYAPGGNVGQDRHVVVADAAGAVSEWSGEHQSYEASPIAVSADGARIATTVISPNALDEIWISERGRPTSRRLVAVPGADCFTPLWSPDGSRIAYFQKGMNNSDGVYVVSADGSGTPRRILRRAPADSWIVLASWSPDGSRILGYASVNGQFDVFDLAASPAAGDAQAPRPFRSGPGQRSNASISPDGRWVAYQSDETGRFEVYVCGYGPGGATGEAVLVSSGGGASPRWSRDGKHLYFASSQNKVLAVALSTQPRLAASEPKPLWDLDQLRIVAPLFDVLPDGRLIGIRRGEGEDDITRYDVVLNFTQELTRRVHAARR
jgi:serine/threonine-protein kinase